MPFSQVPLDIDELIARIKAEAARLEGTPAPSAPSLPPPALSIPKLAEELGARSRYQLGDLLCFQGPDQFLAGAYRALLGREPDEEGSRGYGDHLRRGGSRLYVLYALRHSAEGQAQGVRVDGMPWGGVFRVMPWKRLLGPLLRRAERSYLRRNPQILARADVDGLRRQLDEAHAALLHWAGGMTQMRNAIDGRMHALEEGVGHLGGRALTLEGATAELRGGAEWLRNQIVEVSSQAKGLREVGDRTAEALGGEIARRQRLIKDIDFIRSDLIYHRTQVRELLAKLAQIVGDLPSRRTQAGEMGVLEAPPLVLSPGRGAVTELGQTGALGAPPRAEAVGSDLRAYTEDQMDAYYVAFEEEFRGAQEEIRATQKGYLADIRAAGAGGDADPVLDLGCGRGEWLDLLQADGLRARGVDTNGVMVRQCRERGLEVEQGNALGLLSGLPDGALGAVTAFHLIEHLPFPVLHDLLDHAHRALRPGGTLILETPNPENVLVGSHTFYHDPTHRNPMTPTATRFLVRYFGFEDPEIRRLHPYPEDAKVPGSDPLTERVNGHLCGPQDFAVIARKPAAPV
jgi:SAM-dependent methyltransferase